MLFADVAGFTAMSEARDPEVVHAWMDRFFQLVLDEVHRYEGTVNQFLGDGVMALFGAPVALEDAPRRAVLAALGIQRALAGLEEEGISLPLRIGVHCGPVVVGRIGDDLRMDYTAVGDTTNLAARLQQISSPGEILVSEAARRLLRGFFELEDLGPQELKGKAEPVRAFRVVRERPVTGRFDALAAAGLTPLAGRQRELGTLRTAFEAARDGRGQVCFLVGDAGIGKSRLVYEFRRGLAGEPHLWFEGRCASYGSTTAFQSLVDGLQRLFEIKDPDDDASALGKLGQGIADLGGDLGWTEPWLQKLLSLPVSDPEIEASDAIHRRSETLRALHAIVLRAAETRPVIFTIEDLHWIDPAGEQFLEFLIDSIPAARVCLLLTHRPGYRQPFGDRSYHVRIALQALSRTEMAAMASALLESGSLPRGLHELIASKAEGNPFFVEEVTRSLLEDGALRVTDGRVELARDLADISVPDSIHDVLMARIDRLPEEPKRAIQMASVIGREFALRLLERLVEAGEAVHSVVGELRALELIYQKAAHPELAFMFKHALTHDVAYESVLLKRRRALHEIVGHAIEELYADRLAEHYESLAHHFEQAEAWDRALLYHDRAARKAMDAYANHSAASHLRSALEIAERLGPAVPDDHRRELAESLGHVGFCLNEFTESGDSLERAAAWSDAEARVRNHARAAHSYLWAHHYDEATTSIERALSALGGDECDGAHAIALSARNHQICCTEGLVAEPRLAPERARVVRLLGDLGDAEAVAHTLGLEGLWAEMRGDYHAALSHAGHAIDAARRSGIPSLMLLPTWTLGLARTCLGEYGEALATLRSALDLCIRIGDRALKSRILNTLGWCFAEFGCHIEASECNREGADLARELLEADLVAGADEIHFNASINLAGNLISLGDTDGALGVLEPISSAVTRPGDPWQRWRYSIHLTHALSRADLARGEPEAALARIEGELAEARRHLSKKLVARALELRGRALLHLDRRDEAGADLDEALGVARGIGYPPVVWRTLALRGELARRRGDAEEAGRCVAEAGGLIATLADTLPGGDLRGEFHALAAGLTSEPLAALR